MEKYNLIDALLLNGASLGIILFFLRRWFNRIDETMKTIVGRDRCDERRAVLKESMDKFCATNKQEHRDIWDHINALTVKK